MVNAKRELGENLFTVSGVLSASECEEFIARGEGMGFEAATGGGVWGAGMMTNVGNNDGVVFDDVEWGGMLGGRVGEYVPGELNGGVAVGLNERFRYYRY